MYSIVLTAGDDSRVLAEFAAKEEARAFGDRVYGDYVGQGLLTMEETLHKDEDRRVFLLLEGWNRYGRR